MPKSLSTFLQDGDGYYSTGRLATVAVLAAIIYKYIFDCPPSNMVEMSIVLASLGGGSFFGSKLGDAAISLAERVKKSGAA